MTTLSARFAFPLAAALTFVPLGCDDSPKGAATSSSAVVPAGKSPQIVAATPKHDFGKVKQGKEVAHVFKIRNTGSAPLLIHKAKGS